MFFLSTLLTILQLIQSHTTVKWHLFGVQALPSSGWKAAKNPPDPGWFIVNATALSFGFEVYEIFPVASSKYTGSDGLWFSILKRLELRRRSGNWVRSLRTKELFSPIFKSSLAASMPIKSSPVVCFKCYYRLPSNDWRYDNLLFCLHQVWNCIRKELPWMKGYQIVIYHGVTYFLSLASSRKRRNLLSLVWYVPP